MWNIPSGFMTNESIVKQVQTVSNHLEHLETTQNIYHSIVDPPPKYNSSRDFHIYKAKRGKACHMDGIPVGGVA